VELELSGEAIVPVARCDGEVHLQVALAFDRLPATVSVGRAEGGVLALRWMSLTETSFELAYYQASNAAANLAKALGYGRWWTHQDEQLARPYFTALAHGDLQALAGLYADEIRIGDGAPLKRSKWLADLNTSERAWPERIGHALLEHSIIVELERRETLSDTVAIKRVHAIIAFARRHPIKGAVEAGIGHVTSELQFHYPVDGEPRITVLAECISEQIVQEIPRQARRRALPGRLAMC